MSEDPDDQMNILSDGRATGLASMMDTTPGHVEQPVAADVDMYDMGEDSDPSERGEEEEEEEGEDGEDGEEEGEYVRLGFYTNGIMWMFGRIVDPEE